MKGLFIPNYLIEEKKPTLKQHTVKALRFAGASFLLGSFKCFFCKPMKKIKFDENIEFIERLTHRSVNQSYIVEENESNVFNRIAYLRSAKNININIFINVSAETKTAMIHTVDELNFIFKNTFSKMPNIKLNFAPAKIAKLDPFSINFYEADSKNLIKGVTCFDIYNDSKVSYKNCIDMALVTEVLNNPRIVPLVFMHELMHALFDFNDVYNPALRKSTIMFGDYQQGNISKLSLNDVFIINALCWQDKPDDEQSAKLLKFYIEYEKKIKELLENEEDLER